MKPLTRAQIATIVGGALRSSEDEGDTIVTGVSIDSRTIEPGQLFIPIVAERDGHSFIANAIAKGATGYLCAKDHPLASDPNAPDGAILVTDTVDALTQLGQWHRDTIDPLVVGVTGSNGKTTTKDFIAAALGQCKSVVATKGSFNNELGMPLTLCDLNDDTEVLVCEIGARHIGDIKAAMPALRPTIGVVTTIGAAHVGAFGSESAIAEAKGELLEVLPDDGLAIVNADNPACLALGARTKAKVVSVGTNPGADLHPEALEVSDTGFVAITLDGQTFTSPLAGVHQTTNLLAAIGVADALGIARHDAIAGLVNAQVSPMRMAMTTIGHVTIINDAYNANEGSIIAALDTLSAMATTRRIAVLGMVWDLEDQVESTLSRIAQHSMSTGIDTLISVNANGYYRAGRPDTIETTSIEDGIAALIEALDTTPTVVLVKGSRAEGLERIVTALTTHLEQAA